MSALRRADISVSWHAQQRYAERCGEWKTILEIEQLVRKARIVKYEDLPYELLLKKFYRKGKGRGTYAILDDTLFVLIANSARSFTLVTVMTVPSVKMLSIR